LGQFWGNVRGGRKKIARPRPRATLSFQMGLYVKLREKRKISKN